MSSGLGTPTLGGLSRIQFPILDNHTKSTTFLDKEALDAVTIAVSAAPAVWSMLDEIANDVSATPPDLREGLARAQDVTGRLAENIMLIKEGTLPQAVRKAFREDAHVFVKVSQFKAGF